VSTAEPGWAIDELAADLLRAITWSLSRQSPAATVKALINSVGDAVAREDRRRQLSEAWREICAENESPNVGELLAVPSELEEIHRYLQG
jgi:ATP/maltotriose-dependent transcriptional regulator MalT